MKTTTLSLITIAILGLNGCGSSTTSQTTNTEETNSTKAIALNILTENKIETEGQETLVKSISNALTNNQKMLTTNLLNEEEAITASEKAVRSKANFEDLTVHIATECQDDANCIKEAHTSVEIPLTLTKEEAYILAKETRGEEKGLVSDGLVEKFTCDAGLVKTVQHYGIEDIFSTSNGVEATQQNPASITQDMLNYNNNVGVGFANYDEPNNNRLFLDHITNLPQNISSGRIYIGLKSNGSSLQANDTMSLGNLSQPMGNLRYAKVLTDLSSDGWSNQQVSQTNPTTDIYWNDFTNITMGNQTFLNYVNTYGEFDAYVQDDTSVDFITVATCSKPDPIKEIENIVNQFECNEKEGELLQIIGGTIDAFGSSSDIQTNVSNDFLTRANPYASAEYDETSYDRHLLDTLSLPTGVVINKAEFSIGYKTLNSSLYANDTITVGRYGVEHSGGRYILYPNGTNNTEPFWSVNNISNGEIVRTVDLSAISMNQTGTSVRDWMQGQSEFEVRVEDDTSVDFTHLNLCVTKMNKDENNLTINTQINTSEEQNSTTVEP
jgi:hypothetical protein